MMPSTTPTRVAAYRRTQISPDRSIGAGAVLRPRQAWAAVTTSCIHERRELGLHASTRQKTDSQSDQVSPASTSATSEPAPQRALSPGAPSPTFSASLPAPPVMVSPADPP